MNRYFQDSGSLFRNQRRRTDKDPEFRGQCTVGGTGYWIAAWQNRDKNGNAYLRLRFTEQQQQDRPPPPRARDPSTKSAYPVTRPPEPAAQDEGEDQGWEEILR